MSHFSELKTQIKSKKHLLKALKRMNFETVESKEGVKVRGFFGESIDADFKILTDTHYDIGFVRSENGSYEVVGDWELLPKVSGIHQESFICDLKKNYAFSAIETIAQEKGYQVETVENNGQIEMVVSQ